MKAKNIAIKNITTNTLLVGTQLEWNLLAKSELYFRFTYNGYARA